MYMREIYDITTKQSIMIPDGQLMKICTERGIDYTGISKLTKGELLHVDCRFIIPENKSKLFTFISFDNGAEYDCIVDASLQHYFKQTISSNEYKYLYALRKGRQKLASICGQVLKLKSTTKTDRYRAMKAGGDKYDQTINQQRLRAKIASRLRCRISSALKKNKITKTNELIGCGYDFFMGYLEAKFIEGMSWSNYGAWEIDHIKPMASFDLTDIKQQKLCCHYTNLQPLWKEDNRIKSNKIIALSCDNGDSK